MNAGFIIGIVYAFFAMITMILYDVYSYKKNKKENAETTFLESVLESGSAVPGAGAIWPITLPFLLKEITSDISKE